MAKTTLPPHLQARLNKRRTLFLEHLMFKRTKSRVDIYMQALKEFSKKEIYDLDDQDVLDFLLFKDVNDSGRTVIHHEACCLLYTSPSPRD